MARTPTAAKTPLQRRFGHEENLSRHIAERHMTWLLGQTGTVAIAPAALELPVAAGHPGRKGRLDILQPTDAGSLIVETQYGRSDSTHFEKLEGYAQSARNTFCVVWVAESFCDEHLKSAFQMPFPVWCVKAAADGENAALEPQHPVAEVLLSHGDRLKLHKEREDAYWAGAVEKVKFRIDKYCQMQYDRVVIKNKWGHYTRTDEINYESGRLLDPDNREEDFWYPDHFEPDVPRFARDEIVRYVIICSHKQKPARDAHRKAHPELYY